MIWQICFISNNSNHVTFLLLMQIGQNYWTGYRKDASMYRYVVERLLCLRSMMTTCRWHKLAHGHSVYREVRNFETRLLWRKRIRIHLRYFSSFFLSLLFNLFNKTLHLFHFFTQFNIIGSRLKLFCCTKKSFTHRHIETCSYQMKVRPFLTFLDWTIRNLSYVTFIPSQTWLFG